MRQYNCPACCHYLSMNDGLVEALRDANRMFKEKFENAFAASKWVEKARKQRTTESPVASPASDAEE
eukprot:4420888-Karenia_brevis.AAC.1